MKYEDLSQDELYDAVDLSTLYDDNGTVLDEIPEMDRFVNLDDWLKIDDINYRKY